MNIHDLRTAQVRFENRINEIVKAREELHQLRAAFVRYYNRYRIQNMLIDDYVLGVNLPQSGYNFCYALERQLDGLGRTIGATAFKFGVYYGKTRSDSNYKYRFTKKFGSTYQMAFISVKAAILDLIEAGKNQNIEEIAANPISAMFKGKILSTYFPDRYLNVFSYDHLNYFLIQLDLDTEELIYGDTIYKREALITFKNQDPVMQNWSVDLFAHFLYTEYPGRPPKEIGSVGEDESDPLKDYRTPNFPPNPIAQFINLNIQTPSISGNSDLKLNKRIKRKKPNYEMEARKLKKLGDRGEKIVMDLEAKRLSKAGRVDLAKKIKRVSLESDSYGYDIHSFEEDGRDRLIEVKATRADVGNANFFLSANELTTAMQSDNYYIYMVYEIMSTSPMVWPIENPFNPEDANTIKIPMNYRILINVKKP